MLFHGHKGVGRVDWLTGIFHKAGHSACDGSDIPQGDDTLEYVRGDSLHPYRVVYEHKISEEGK